MTEPPARPIRRSFAWNLVGNSLYSLSQWGLLVVLARAADTTEVGRFALLLALSAPAFLMLGLNLRVVQAADAERRWTLSEFLLLRHLVNVGAMVVTVILVSSLTDGLLATAIGLGAAKSVEGLSQTYYGFFQQCDRHDFVAQSMVARSVAGPVGFLVGYQTGGLFGACVGLMGGWLSVQLLADRPRALRLADEMGVRSRIAWQQDRRNLRSLFRHSFPLGVDQGITSLTVNAPRYVVQGHLGTSALGVYSTLGYLAQVVTMIASSLGVVVVPRLAQHKRDGRRAAFVRILLLSTLVSMAVAVAAMLAAAIAGDWAIGLVLGPEYVDSQLLLVLLLGAAAVTLQRSLGRALTGAHRFVTFLVIDVLTLVVTAAAAVVLAPAYGAVGAAWATVAGNLAGAAACIVPVWRVIRSLTPPSPGDASSGAQRVS